MRRTPLKPGKRIVPQSDKRKRDNKERAVLREQLLAERGPLCEYPDCRRKWVDMHEVKKRSRGGSILDPDNIKLLCRPHHEWTEREPNEAQQMGFLKHSWE
jgi:hypothetical protein